MQAPKCPDHTTAGAGYPDPPRPQLALTGRLMAIPAQESSLVSRSEPKKCSIAGQIEPQRVAGKKNAEMSMFATHIRVFRQPYT